MLLFLLVLVIGLTSSVREVSSTQQPINNSPDPIEDFWYPTTNFSDTFDWKLLKAFSAQPRNLLISPTSLKIILALLYQASSASTAREFQNVLQFLNADEVKQYYSELLKSLQSSTENEIELGTTIFADIPIEIKPYFKRIAKDSFHTPVVQTNFSDPEAASMLINKWFRIRTHNRVNKFIDPNELKQTILLIANTIYFKGIWLTKFPLGSNYEGKFYRSVDYQDRSQMITLNVPFMTVTKKFYFKSDDALDCKIIRLPYTDRNYAMFIVLPNSLGGLSNLIKKLNINKISELMYGMSETTVEVHLPKFKFNYQAKFAQILEEFGLQQIFQNTASLTNLVVGNSTVLRKLVVSDIIQKSAIEVDEEGTVAFSATQVNVGNKMGEHKEIFKATHPFLFYVEGPGGSVLYIGKVENPLDDQEKVSPLPARAGTGEEAVQRIPALEPSTQSPQRYPSPNYPSSNTYPSVHLPADNYAPTSQNSIPNAGGLSDLSPNLSPDFSPNLSPNLDESYYPIPPDRDELTYRFNLFDLELLNAFGETTTNVFISPASIKTTLAMILEGAKGTTAAEISEALRIPDVSQPAVRKILMNLINNLNEQSGRSVLENHNALFVSDDYAVIEDYRRKIEEYYRGAIKSLSFRNVGAAANVINQWVKEATKGIIKEAVSPQSLHSDTGLVISNALYFKGQWQDKFNPLSTQQKYFTTPNGRVLTSMMHTSRNFNYSYITELRSHAVEIPYQGKFSMLILLPNEESNVRSVIRDIGHFKLVDILKQMKSTELILEMPKFTFEYSADLVENLKHLKIREMFGINADLSGIIRDRNVMVNKLIHKTRIELDEEGTVAAASTNAVIVPLMGTHTFIADRPFIFCIYHTESSNIIFEGIMLNPEEQRPVATRGGFYGVGNRFQ